MNIPRALAALLDSAAARSKPLLHPASAAAILQSSSLFSTKAASAPAKRPGRKASNSPTIAPAPPELSPPPEPWCPPPETEQSPPLPLKASDPPPEPIRSPPPPLKPASELARPTEIPFQPRVANVVHLVGTIGVGVELESSPSGTYSAVTVLVHPKTKDSPQFWIPVIFHGDLAQIAAFHLKEDQLVYVTGQLSGNGSPTINKDAQTGIQVLAHSINFVGDNGPEKEDLMVLGPENVGLDCSDSKSSPVNEAPSGVVSAEEDLPALRLWNELLSKPQEWWDNRTSKVPSFKHKSSGELLRINESTPDWVLSKLDGLSFCKNTTKFSHKGGNSMGLVNSRNDLWNDFVANPQRWQDNRKDKLNGLVHPKYPDYTHKDTKKGIWLHNAPDLVLSKLGLDLDRQKTTGMQSKQFWYMQREERTEPEEGDHISRDTWKLKKGAMSSVSNKKNNESSWKDLLENPNKWWDNRLGKLNPKAPDFKHKDTGEALWLSTSPLWVLPKLPPSNAEKKKPNQFKRDTLLS